MFSQKIIELSRPYRKWVEWSDEDQCFVCYCPDLQIVCHYEDNPTDEVASYKDLLDVIYHLIKIDIEEGVALPKPSSAS